MGFPRNMSDESDATFFAILALARYLGTAFATELGGFDHVSMGNRERLRMKRHDHHSPRKACSNVTRGPSVLFPHFSQTVPFSGTSPPQNRQISVISALFEM